MFRDRMQGTINKNRTQETKHKLQLVDRTSNGRLVDQALHSNFLAIVMSCKFKKIHHKII